MILDVFLNHNAKLRHPELAVGTYGYIGVFKGTFSLKKDSSFASFSPHALKGQKLLAQGNGRKQHALKGQKLLAQGNGRKQHALKGQKLLAQGNGRKQHALKGQKLLAQGNALGYHVRKLGAL